MEQLQQNGDRTPCRLKNHIMNTKLEFSQALWSTSQLSAWLSPWHQQNTTVVPSSPWNPHVLTFSCAVNKQSLTPRLQIAAQCTGSVTELQLGAFAALHTQYSSCNHFYGENATNARNSKHLHLFVAFLNDWAVGCMEGWETHLRAESNHTGLWGDLEF